MTTFSSPESSTKGYSQEQVDSISDAQLLLMVSSYLFMIKSSANVSVQADEWAVEFLPDDDILSSQLFRRFLVRLAVLIRGSLKLAMWGAFLRLLLLLALGYQDMVTDVLVAIEYFNTGQLGAAYASFGILGVAIVFHMLICFGQHRKKPLKKQLMYMLASMCFLMPLIESYNVWTGKEQHESDGMAPILVLIATRAIELIVESFPECVLQLQIALSNTSNLSSIMVFSICSSVAAAAAIMTDTNISYELGRMNKQDRGRDSHPLYGLVPADRRKIGALYIGFFSFHAGYMLTSLVMVTTCTMAGLHIAYIALWFLFEVFVMYAELERTGRGYFPLPTSKAIGYVLWFVVGPLMQNFIPFVNSRIPGLLGGRMFSGWICWRLVTNSLAFAFAIGRWGDSDADEGRASAQFMVALYTGAVLGAVVGAVIVFCTVEKSHRWTLWQTRQTAREATMKSFLGQPLTFSCKTVDGQALDNVMGFHPSFLDKEAVREFLMKLSVDHPLFADDAVFPKEAGDEAGHVYSHFFEVELQHVEFYGDPALTASVAEHFDDMKAKIEARANERAQQIESLSSSLQAGGRRRRATKPGAPAGGAGSSGAAAKAAGREAELEARVRELEEENARLRRERGGRP
ncbi:hypothetical protein TeGR_g10534 [Tetraparma gracilis]|uniref:Uncharacterized protein n=1 Tax=Tetraparma gracilis TaxID=2962635 RepID=A0ABQ6MM54_9STRA|nr:hypothetical protein TeGR_g10534 [Tetraparma gracilis]